MAVDETQELASRKWSLPGHGTVLAVFTATLFVSALLLFGVQPMFAKMVLPKLGGSAAVWSIALVFFQSVLLFGYAYAHLLTSKLRPNTAVIVHVVVLAVALLFLPVAYPAGWEQVPQSGLPLWLIGLFAVGVGVPFFAISASAPLLQYWFSRTGHPHSSDPYFLYGASNIGSFAALLCYPFVLEPLLPLGGQSFLWTVGYLALGAMVACCGALLWTLGSKARTGADAIRTAAAAPVRPSAVDRLWWISLAMVPSGLLVGVTAHITTDLAAAPFLWVVPLALFLLTFVITFQRKPVLSHHVMLRLHSLAVGALLIILFTPLNGVYMPVLHLAAFFISAMVCHGELVRRRPQADRLTEFYLWMSFGGVLGGLFAGLIAPQIFSQILEYPILMLAVFLVRKDAWEVWQGLDKGLALAAAALVVVVGGIVFDPLAQLLESGRVIVILGVPIAAVLVSRYPMTQFVLLAAGLVFVFSKQGMIIERSRGFFGVNTVIAKNDGRFHLLVHGTTIHGVQDRHSIATRAGGERPEPLVYYHFKGPIATAVEQIRNKTGSLSSVGVIGLGAGAMACLRQPGERWKYFEINPQVVRLARNPAYFTYLAECGESDGIVVGDGRITIAAEPDRSFDIIILDAFSSDAIPVHLLTEQAMSLYLSKLKTGGALIFHISNRFMELGSVIASLAKPYGAVTYVNRDGAELWGTDTENFKTAAVVAVVGRDVADLGAVATDTRWRKIAEDTGTVAWTDDYSNVLSAIYRMYRYGKLPPEPGKSE